MHLEVKRSADGVTCSYTVPFIEVFVTWKSTVVSIACGIWVEVTASHSLSLYLTSLYDSLITRNERNSVLFQLELLVCVIPWISLPNDVCEEKSEGHVSGHVHRKCSQNSDLTEDHHCTKYIQAAVQATGTKDLLRQTESQS